MPTHGTRLGPAAPATCRRAEVGVIAFPGGPALGRRVHRRRKRRQPAGSSHDCSATNAIVTPGRRTIPFTPRQPALRQPRPGDTSELELELDETGRCGAPGRSSGPLASKPQRWSSSMIKVDWSFRQVFIASRTTVTATLIGSGATQPPAGNDAIPGVVTRGQMIPRRRPSTPTRPSTETTPDHQSEPRSAR